MGAARIFLLSPALLSGRRGALLWREGATFPLARSLQGGDTAPLGEVFAFVSGLYFRGKLTYARAFARGPAGAPGALVITPSRGLLPPETPVSLADLAALREVDVHPANPAYRLPLEAAAVELASAAPQSEVVLLGSVATAKYSDVLLGIFGGRLLFPCGFESLGDMSRGSVLLRAAGAGVELEYRPVAELVHRARSGAGAARGRGFSRPGAANFETHSTEG